MGVDNVLSRYDLRLGFCRLGVNLWFHGHLIQKRRELGIIDLTRALQVLQAAQNCVVFSGKFHHFPAWPVRAIPTHDANL
jgi:hypothetical protein